MANSQGMKLRKVFPAKVNWDRVLLYGVLSIGATVAIIPFLYMVMSSLKSYGSIINNNFWPWWPLGTESIQWNNYPEAIQNIGFDRQWGVSLMVRYFINSGVMAVTVVIGTLVTSILAAYTLAFINIPGKSVFFFLILATLMIPNDMTLVPKVVMMFNFQWYNSYLALTVPFFVSVFGIFLLRQFFLQIPKELFDAALIDGAGHLRYLAAIVLPLAAPAVITVALLTFIWTWDSFKWPLLVTRDSNMRVLAVGLQQYLVGEGGTKTQLMMAFSTMVVMPVLIFYFFTQKYFTEGIARTGIKG
jgi:ABC-type glycerol-3-phosphate transport system permease component